jgi:hypothetical protein
MRNLDSDSTDSASHQIAPSYAAECWCGWWVNAASYDQASALATIHENETHHSQTAVET